MFEILMELPLFRGISHEKMEEIVGSLKFHFLKYPVGEKIVSAGEKCMQIKFVISGSVKLVVSNRNKKFMVAETLLAPDVIAPDFLFGRDTDYPCDVIANEDTGILQLSKDDFIKILTFDNIFLFNYLNILSVNAQKAMTGVLSLSEGTLEQRIAFWIVALTQPGSTDVTVSCKHRDLYSLFGVQRMAFISALDSLVAKGLMTYDKNTINVIDRKALSEMVIH